MPPPPATQHSAPTQRAASTASGRSRDDRILVVWPGGATSAIVTEGEPVIIGRGADVPLRANHPSVSRRHARITLEPGGYVIEDLGSQNGTWFGPERLESKRVRRAGNAVSVRLGEALVFVQRSGRKGRRRGRPPGVAEFRRHVEMVALGDMPVLVVGETGSGKNNLAVQLHGASLRRSLPLVRASMLAYSRERLEAAIAEGVAAGDAAGAQGTTVLLDEVGDLDAAAQASLLEVLDRANSGTRFVATTHRDLDAMVRAGNFRSDLYHRLAGFTVTVPPLRERLDELPSLAAEFTERAAEARGLPSPTIAPEAMAALKRYTWPGNVRELGHVLECAVLLSTAGVIRLDALPARVTTARRSTPPPAPRAADAPTKLRGELDAIERRRILEALERCAGNQTRAAKVLGIGRRTLLKRLDDYGITRPRRRSE